MYSSLLQQIQKATSLQLTVTLISVRELVEAKLVNEAKGHVSMLEHVVERKILNEIRSGVNVGVRLVKGRFDDKRGRISSFGS